MQTLELPPHTSYLQLESIFMQPLRLLCERGDQHPLWSSTLCIIQTLSIMKATTPTPTTTTTTMYFALCSMLSVLYGIDCLPLWCSPPRRPHRPHAWLARPADASPHKWWSAKEKYKNQIKHVVNNWNEVQDEGGDSNNLKLDSDASPHKWWTATVQQYKIYYT